MPEPVAIVTDSTQYLPRELADARGVHQVSLYVGWQGQPERELEMDGFDAFYERLAQTPSCRRPRNLRSATSSPCGSRCWKRAGTSSRSTSRAVSRAPYEAARQAHGLLSERGLGERVEVIDSETACGGLGLLVLAASAAAADGRGQRRRWWSGYARRAGR